MQIDTDIARIVMTLTALILGITVHEWAHAFAADRIGDNTPRSQGRVTLWPLDHLDPLGTALMILTTITGFGFGWGKPVQTDPAQYKIDRRLGSIIVAFAGPLSNVVIAALFAGLYHLHLVPPGDAFEAFMVRIIIVNLVLFAFNLIPITPLDGSHILANSLPRPMGEAYLDFMSKFGIIIFLVLVFTRTTSYFVIPVVSVMIQLLGLTPRIV